MSNKKIKIDGIYDVETVRMLQDESVYDLSFDFRPRSLNFIQTYKVEEILHSTSVHNVYLQFDNEKDFVINKIADDLKICCEKGKLYLEFFDFKEVEFYEQFNLPFFIHIDQDLRSYEHLFSSPKFKGAVLNGSFLNELHRYGSLQYFAERFMASFSNAPKDAQLILQRDWHFDIFPSIEVFFDFNMVALPINSSIENCFRSVDLPRMKSELKFII